MAPGPTRAAAAQRAAAVGEPLALDFCLPIRRVASRRLAVGVDVAAGRQVCRASVWRRRFRDARRRACCSCLRAGSDERLRTAVPAAADLAVRFQPIATTSIASLPDIGSVTLGNASPNGSLPIVVFNRSSLLRAIRRVIVTEVVRAAVDRSRCSGLLRQRAHRRSARRVRVFVDYGGRDRAACRRRADRGADRAGAARDLSELNAARRWRRTCLRRPSG